MAVPPLIPELPEAPSRAEGQAAFNLTAEPFIAALPPMVVNVNTSLTWIGQQVTAVDGYRQAAATSAQNAADSATAAGQKVQLAADQVGLAKTARTGAEAARDAAQASALAAGAAAGLPPQRVPFTVLQINAAGNVAWGTGLPDTAAALPGQALVLGAGKVPGWGYAGAQIGDVLYSSRNPGAGYLPANGGIYLQSAYPAYFALLGLIGGQRAVSFTAKALSAILNVIEFGENGVVLGVTSNCDIYRSTDYGNTFVLVASALSTQNSGQLLHLGGSTWMLGNNDNKILRTTDNGSTWTPVSIGSTFARADTDKNGVVIVQTSTVMLRSVNYGQSFSNLVSAPFSLGMAFNYIGNGRWVAQVTTTTVAISDDAFSSSVTKSLNGTTNGNVLKFIPDLVGGVVLGYSSNGGVAALNLAVSYDRGDTWGVMASGSAYALQSVVFAGLDTWLIYGAQSTSTYDMRKSTNGAKTFAQYTNIGTVTAYMRLTSDPLKGQVIATTGQTGSSAYYLSSPVLGYDGTTQFKVPTLTKQEGVNPYVRAA